jgi:hypothetical protein
VKAFDPRKRRLKAGCSQDWLPHLAAKPQRVVAIHRDRGGRVQGRQADLQSAADCQSAPRVPEASSQKFVAAREEINGL